MPGIVYIDQGIRASPSTSSPCVLHSNKTELLVGPQIHHSVLHLCVALVGNIFSSSSTKVNSCSVQSLPPL